MKIIVSGALGHMGREVLALAAEGVRGAEAVGGIDPMYGGGDAPVPCVRSFEEAFSHPVYGDAFRSGVAVAYGFVAGNVHHRNQEKQQKGNLFHLCQNSIAMIQKSFQNRIFAV